MMLAVQDGCVALGIVVFVDFCHLPGRWFRHGQRQVLAVTDPGALLARGGFNVEKA